MATSLMTTAHALMALASTPGGIYAGVAVCGFAFGVVWPLMVVLAGDFFGLKYLGKCLVLRSLSELCLTCASRVLRRQLQFLRRP